MNVWVNLPVAAQLALICALGAMVGGQVNRGIYRLAWVPRPIGPWSEPPPDAPPRAGYDRIPILGWFFLRRESPLHGRGYWIRPCLIEIALAAGFAALYWWESSGGLLPRHRLAGPQPLDDILGPYLGHVSLIALMTVATFIDFDDQTIPDAITIPGTLFGLLWSLILPYASLPIPERPPAAMAVEALRLSSPLPWPGWLDQIGGLALGVGCLVAWCWALIPKLWTTRRGVRKAVPLLVASMVRSGWCRPMFGLALAGTAVIGGAWLVGGPWWQSLLSALVGMAVAGGMIWAVRIIAGTFLGEEAMGFGDVTLMAMIGTFLGWQASIMVFFLAPFVAVFVAVGQWLFTGRREIAYGPYLCFAAVILIIRWDALWEGYAAPVLQMALGGWEFPVFVAGILLLLGPMLWAVRAVKEQFARREA